MDNPQPYGKSWWRSLDDVFSILLMVAIAVVLALQVFCRFVLNYSLGWTDELAGILFGWLIFFAAATLLKRQSHMGMRLIWGLSEKGNQVLDVIVEVVCGAFYVTILVGAWDLLVQAQNFVTPALEIPGQVKYAIIPVAAVYLVARTGIRIWQVVRGPRPDWLKE